MENLKADLAELFENTNDIANKQTQIVRLEIYERLTNLISKGIINLVLIIICCFILSLINFAVAFYLSDFFESVPLGFLTLGGFYLVVLIIFAGLRKRIAKNALKNALLKGLMPEISEFDDLVKNQRELTDELEFAKAKLHANIVSLKVQFGLTNDDISEDDLSSQSSIADLTTSIYTKIFKKQPGLISKFLLPFALNSILSTLSKKETEEKVLSY